MARTKALRPEEVVKTRKESLPEAVLEIFNQLIIENFDGRSATVYQEAVIRKLVDRGFSRKEIFQRGWLDVEDIYREAGWKVMYDKPAYCETYEAYFEFRTK